MLPHNSLFSVDQNAQNLVSRLQHSAIPDFVAEHNPSLAHQSEPAHPPLRRHNLVVHHLGYRLGSVLYDLTALVHELGRLVAGLERVVADLRGMLVGRSC